MQCLFIWPHFSLKIYRTQVVELAQGALAILTTYSSFVFDYISLVSREDMHIGWEYLSYVYIYSSYYTEWLNYETECLISYFMKILYTVLWEKVQQPSN